MRYIATFFRHNDETGQQYITAEDHASAVIEAESLLQEGEHVIVGEVA